MKRFDRAMYAFFLLVLLADCARLHGSVNAGGDAAGALMLTAAGHLEVGPSGEAILVLRHADGSSSHIATLNRFGFRLSGWSSGTTARFASSHSVAGIFRSPSPGSPVVLSFVSPVQSFSAAQTFFEHTGSPAP